MSAHGHNIDDEMHELNFEADYLEGQQHSPKKVNGQHTRGRSDPDAQAMVIESLKSQIQDLFSQVTQLNAKLVKSYDRVSDLEDEIHVTSANLRASTLKVSNLELERTQHLSALSTGLLVEKDHVTAELTRLMEKATEEAARRGQAETARAAIEQDLDDLSAGLFDQANRMVAEARLARAMSERKVEETEQALKGVEEVVGALQSQMQALQTEKELSEQKLAEMRVLIGKGKWVSRPEQRHTTIRYLSCHSPYNEYLQFIAHLRSIRPQSSQAPAVTSLLPLPFLARLVSEDSDPTVRLDLAPSLSWLTRRSVLSAIHSGQLTVEPMSTPTLLEELAPPTIPATNHHTHVTCALCGTLILEPPQLHSNSRPPHHPQTFGRNGTWSSAFKSSLQTITTAANSTTVTRVNTPNHPTQPPSQVYIFRLATTSSSGLPVSLPLSQQPAAGQSRPTIYPLCTSGWCLSRMRTTCTLWAFVRTNIVEKVWEEDWPVVPASIESHKSSSAAIDTPTGPDHPPATPAKKSRIGIGALWGTMQRGLSGSKGDESPKSPVGKRPESPTPEKRDSPKSPPARRLPPPPPRHPPLSTPIPAVTTSSVHADADVEATPVAVKPPAGPPPPLPQRNRGRDSRPTSLTITNPPATAVEEADKPKLSAPPVEMSRSESHDSFSTPTEEISVSNLDGAVSPSDVPLPVSSPATPQVVESASPQTPPAVPPFASSEKDNAKPPPRPQSPSAIVTRDVPSRPATPSGGAPPPLPRRAAGRVRPVSVVAQSAPEPAPEPPKSPAIVEEDKAPVEEPTPPVEAPQPSQDESSKQADDLQSPPPLPTREQTPNVSGTATPILDGETAHLGKLDEIALSTPPEEHDNVTITDVKDHAEGINTGTGTEQQQPTQEPEEDVAEEEKDSEGDIHGTFVGDATWEERTWKDLVRLREDMFYARMGCVR
ncbi:proline-rich protein [Cristinia sonorae]|uniref:Proline-rich protein n=1 Tax=Cristinia sonorae TaxID=1940300 RepID=A0A8K0XRX3_9AGAR|nr:proline-rich protein [Cristinia sonorae]